MGCADDPSRPPYDPLGRASTAPVEPSGVCLLHRCAARCATPDADCRQKTVVRTASAQRSGPSVLHLSPFDCGRLPVTRVRYLHDRAACQSTRSAHSATRKTPAKMVIAHGSIWSAPDLFLGTPCTRGGTAHWPVSPWRDQGRGPRPGASGPRHDGPRGRCECGQTCIRRRCRSKYRRDGFGPFVFPDENGRYPGEVLESEWPDVVHPSERLDPSWRDLNGTRWPAPG